MTARRCTRRVRHTALSNIDMLAWFSEEEREPCSDCRERACVSLPRALASFCLHCGAVTVDGRRIDADGRLDVPPDSA